VLSGNERVKQRALLRVPVRRLVLAAGDHLQKMYSTKAVQQLEVLKVATDLIADVQECQRAQKLIHQQFDGARHSLALVEGAEEKAAAASAGSVIVLSKDSGFVQGSCTRPDLLPLLKNGTGKRRVIEVDPKRVVANLIEQSPLTYSLLSHVNGKGELSRLPAAAVCCVLSLYGRPRPCLMLLQAEVCVVCAVCV
jgi:hypothetical protein